jgi:hypothetical protein
MAAPATLPRGLVDTDGRRHRDVSLAPADGWLERAVTSTVGSSSPPPAARHALLASCTEHIGGYVEPDAATIALLTRGELDLLGFWVRQAISGDLIRLVVRCAIPSCAALSDLDLTVGDLLPAADADDPEWLIADGGTAGRIVLRPVNGADEESLAHVVGSAPERTAALMARLVRSVEVRDGDDVVGLGPIDPAGWSALAPALRHAALLALAEQPAAPTTRLEVACSSCGSLVEVQIDPLVLLAKELRAGGDRLLVETHCLAYHYGWSEDDALSLPRRRRWGYLSLLRAELTGTPLTTELDDGW